jgi:hypothetical protein
MRSAVGQRLFCWLAAALAASFLASTLPCSAQQPGDTFHWVDFHSAKDQSVIVWVTRSMQVSNWTAIREIGVQYDAALVVTTNRSNPQGTPGADTFTVWSASLTSHLVAPLVTGVNLRWFDRVRFADGIPEEWPVLYDNCHDCAANTYFTSFYYDLRRHAWGARWMSGGHGIPVWNTSHPAGVDWTQVYGVLSDSQAHVALYTWNHFDYGKSKKPNDFLYRYDLDPFSSLERTVELSGKQADAAELNLCRGQDAVEGLLRGQDSPLCQQLLKQRAPRQPVTTPPANNRGQMR